MTAMTVPIQTVERAPVDGAHPPVTTALPATTSRSMVVAPSIRAWLRVEGLAGFVAGIALFVALGGPWLLAIPLLLVPDASALGYLRGPRVGAMTYNLVHNWAIGLVVLGIGLWSGGPQGAQAARPSDVHLVTENMSFSQADLKANAGLIVVELENHDLFWHTFTIPELNVDLKVPMQATQQVALEAPAGTYTFHCTIPGHDMLGMTGTLTVK